MSERLQAEVWQSLGHQDPDWAVVSTPGKEHGGWLDDLDAFYREGELRVGEALDMLTGRSIGGRALDWGSGTGRLSFALRAAGFEHVTCVDISTSMLEKLRERAEQRGVDGLCLTTVDAFVPAGDHDLALSLITLQHFPNRSAVLEAVAAMAGSLKSGGHLVIELPLRPHNLRYRIQPRLQVYRVLRRLGVSPTWLHSHGLSGISMLCMPADAVLDTLASLGLQLVGFNTRRGTSHQMAYYAARRS